MRETVFKKVLSVLLCAVLLVGAVPLDVHAEEAAGLTEEQRQAILGRQMDDWNASTTSRISPDAGEAMKTPSTAAPIMAAPRKATVAL